MKKILSFVLLACSLQLFAQDTAVTYSELGEKLAGNSDCSEMKKLLEINYGAKYGHNNVKYADRAFAKWKVRVEYYIENQWCSPEDYIQMTLEQSHVEKRFVTCMEIFQLSNVLDKNKPDEKKIIDEINAATATWYCKPEDFKKFKDKIDVFKK
jgi:hypothetical protein